MVNSMEYYYGDCSANCTHINESIRRSKQCSSLADIHVGYGERSLGIPDSSFI